MTRGSDTKARHNRMFVLRYGNDDFEIQQKIQDVERQKGFSCKPKVVDTEKLLRRGKASTTSGSTATGSPQT